MAITIKSAREIELMRESCRLLSEVHDRLKEAIKPGISTYEINALGERLIRGYGCEPNFLNYNGYPASICVSVNDEVVHGIPKKERILEEGDIVSLDAGLIYKGYHSDAARTYPVGTVSADVQQLMDVTRQSFLKELNLQGQAVIYMTFQEPLMPMQANLDMGSSVTLSDTESELICMKIHRFLTSNSGERELSFSRV